MEGFCCVVLVGALLVAGVSDLLRRLVPNGCAAAILASGLVVSFLEGSLARALAGVVVVALVMVGAAVVFGRARGRPGVGGGDVKLLAALAAWTGPLGGLLTVALSCLLGLVGWVVAALIWRLKGSSGRLSRAIPLAPAIALAALVVAFAEWAAPL